MMKIFPTDKLFLVNVIFPGTTMLRFECKWLDMAVWDMANKRS
jgi:hypothetical protein